VSKLCILRYLFTFNVMALTNDIYKLCFVIELKT
jgi:hypothetical protein